MVKLAILVSVLFALAGLVACGSSDSVAPADAPVKAPATTAAVAAPQPTASVADITPADAVLSAEIVIVTDTLPERLDPTRLKANSDKRNHVFTFDALRNLGPDGHYQSLATGFKVSPDGLAVDWTLREGVNYHNGDPFTARDVEFTYKTVAHGFGGEKSIHTYASAHRTIESFEVTGDHSIRFNLSKPFPDLFSSMRAGTLEIVGKDYYEAGGVEGFSKHPIGTGPFKFVEFKLGDRYILEANEDYWGEGPFVKRITILDIPEPTTRFLMLKSGDADIVLGLAGDQLTDVVKDPDLELARSKQAFIGAALFFPGTKSPIIAGRVEGGDYGFTDDKFLPPASAARTAQVKFYENPKVRLAFGMAIDRAAIAEELAPACEVAHSYIPPAAFGYDSSDDAHINFKYDPEGAKKLLLEAGIPLDGTFEETFTGSPRSSYMPAVQMWDAMIGYWNAIGLNMTRRQLDAGQTTGENRSNTHPGIYNFSGTNPVDGGRLTWTRFSRNSTWSDAIQRDDYDALFTAIKTEGDPDTRSTLIGDFMRAEAVNMESIPLWWCDQTFGYNKKTIASMSPTPGLGDDFNAELIKPVTK
jgi:peptide/nickel transport system substrate-binding protein